LAELKTWEAIRVYDELELRTNDWYTLAILVAGFTREKVSALVIFMPIESVTAEEGGRPTRSSVTGDFAGVAGDVGATGLDRSFTSLVAQTPDRSGHFGGPVGAGAGAPPYIPGIELGRGPRVEDEDVEPVRPPGPLLGPQSHDQIDAALLNAAETIIAEREITLARSGATVVQSGATSRTAFLKQQEARAPGKPAYTTDDTPAARAMNQSVRALAASSRVWVSRGVATGVYYLSPGYTAARASAHMHIASRAPHLRGVKLEYFARDGPSDSAQYRIRVQFARLIGEMYNLVRQNSNRSAKLASDTRNISRSAEEILRWFVALVQYDEYTNSFTDSGPTRRDNRLEMIPFEAPGKRCNPYALCDPHSPLKWMQPAYCNPLLFVPGTLMRGAHLEQDLRFNSAISERGLGLGSFP
jgi:hypothetical protein